MYVNKIHQENVTLKKMCCIHQEIYLYSLQNHWIPATLQLQIQSMKSNPSISGIYPHKDNSESSSSLITIQLCIFYKAIAN